MMRRQGACSTRLGTAVLVAILSLPVAVLSETAGDITEHLRLMTWNVRMGHDLAGRANVDGQVELMAASGAHVIALQEVTITPQGNLPALYEARLEALTGKPWHAVWAPAPRPATTTPEGNLLLTSLPVVSSSTLPIDSAPWDPKWLDTKRSAAQLSVVFAGTTVNVFGTHLALTESHRNSQAKALMSWIESFPAPRLLGGDFNMVAGTNAYSIFAASFTDVWAVLARDDHGFTIDARASAGGQPGRIDYWWQDTGNSQVRATEVWVVKTTRSDHHALMMDVEVR